jgi:hypothetical protein
MQCCSEPVFVQGTGSCYFGTLFNLVHLHALSYRDAQELISIRYDNEMHRRLIARAHTVDTDLIARAHTADTDDTHST